MDEGGRQLMLEARKAAVTVATADEHALPHGGGAIITNAAIRTELIVSPLDAREL